MRDNEATGFVFVLSPAMRRRSFRSDGVVFPHEDVDAACLEHLVGVLANFGAKRTRDLLDPRVLCCLQLFDWPQRTAFDQAKSSGRARAPAVAQRP